MCTNGVNANQLTATIEMIDESVSINRRWTHRLFHTTENAGFVKTASQLKRAQELLDEVRAILDETKDIASDESENLTTVELL